MTLDTPWTATVNREQPLPEHPRPQLVRPGWTILNGPWSYAVTPFVDGDPTAVPHPAGAPRRWRGEIVVPFSPETPLSVATTFMVRNLISRNPCVGVFIRSET